MNPDVTEWLRTEEGETWSCERIRRARAQEYEKGGTGVCLWSWQQIGDSSLLCVPGMFGLRNG